MAFPAGGSASARQARPARVRTVAVPEASSGTGPRAAPNSHSRGVPQVPPARRPAVLVPGPPNAPSPSAAHSQAPRNLHKSVRLSAAAMVSAAGAPGIEHDAGGGGAMQVPGRAGAGRGAEAPGVTRGVVGWDGGGG